MSLSKSSASPIHIAVFPTAGMGHLTPFLRVASELLSRGCHVTLISAVPTVSAAESKHISSFLRDHPQVNHAELETVPPRPGAVGDPFFLQWEATRQSLSTLLSPLLNSLNSPFPLSALIADLAFMSSAGPAAAELRLPCYTICVSSVRFVCVASRLPGGLGAGPLIDVPGVGPVEASSLPPPFMNPNHPFTKSLTENMRELICGGTNNNKGIIVNSFEWLEPEALKAVNDGRVTQSLPKVFAIGPLDAAIAEPSRKEDIETHKEYMEWLDGQPKNSVVYVSFGSRSAMSSAQIVEVSKGLEKSGVRFLWILKTTKLDKDEKYTGGEIEELLGESFLERTKHRGLIIRGWARQREILMHDSIGLFFNHSGWNSIMESARIGVPMLVWPLGGDQMLAAEVVESSGFGVWPKGWRPEGLICGDEIAKVIGESVEDEKLKQMTQNIRREAHKAVSPGGTSDKAITAILDFLRLEQNGI